MLTWAVVHELLLNAAAEVRRANNKVALQRITDGGSMTLTFGGSLWQYSDRTCVLIVEIAPVKK
jgi:hypothetical protein